ncbi:MAG: hypothetical protein HQ567_26670 [Candidatus Nealsonbacteria bacterium]|nr:hypothetical protein [Candidatus Nealsonbacteria bacterium]
MSKRQNASGAQLRADRPQEQEAVRTTIVGGRPPGSGQNIGEIPRGIEVLVKKAAVDPQFRTLLLEKRAEAADAIGLKLEPAETMMLAAVPTEQLETIIARTDVPDGQRRAFLGKVAAAMLAAMGLTAPGCEPPTAGIRPEEGEEPSPPKIKRREHRDGFTGGAQPEPEPEPPPEENESGGEDDGDRPGELPVTDGIRPDRPPTTKGIRPDRIPAPTGSRPDPPDAPPGAAPE